MSIYDYLGEGCNGSMFLSPVDEQEIIRTVQQFKNKVSTDFTFLFIMFINDIVNASKLFKFILFADDANMFYCNNDINELILQTNAELDKLNVWFSVNRLSLNIAKTNYMIFGNCALKTSLFIKINKFTINRVEAATF